MNKRRTIFLIFASVLSLSTSINAVTNTKHATACEQETLKLKCEDDNYIVILSGNYGRTSAGVCGTTSGDIKNVTCYNEDTVSTLKEICEGEQQCDVQSSNEVFGDSCLGTYKYLYVLYRCAAVKEFKKALACENGQAKMECQNGQHIRILEANYGRKSRHTCAYGTIHTTNCGSTTALDLVSEKCNNERKCNINASNNKFGDPCVGTFKYLSVKYKCVHGKSSEEILEGFKCNDGKTISESQMCNGVKECSEGDDEFLCDYQSKFACEGKTLKIKCKKDETIRVINANFGRLSPDVCPKRNRMNKLNCVSNDAFEIIQTECDARNKCEIESSAEEFGNPCGDTFKYTEVHYECVKNLNAKHAIDIRSVKNRK